MKRGISIFNIFHLESKLKSTTVGLRSAVYDFSKSVTRLKRVILVCCKTDITSSTGP